MENFEQHIHHILFYYKKGKKAREKLRIYGRNHQKTPVSELVRPIP